MNIMQMIPKMLVGDELMEALKVVPDYDEAIRIKSQAERLLALDNITSIYLPSIMGCEIYSKMYLTMAHSLKKKVSRDAIKQQNRNALAIKNKASSFGGILGGMDCCSIIGESGIGKSLSIERAVELLKGNEIIELEETKIIPIIIIQCPFDCSTKSLLLSICKKIDEALGTNYYDMQIRAKAAINIMILSVGQMLINHCCLLVIDEIQNLVKHKAGSQLVTSLTQLLNEAGVGIVMVGTPEIVPFFEGADYLARRAIGLCYSRCAYDDYFFNFCNEIWKYQYVSNTSEITDTINHYLYEHSAGKLSNVIFLFYTAQEISILNGRECIDMEALEEAYQRMQMLHSYIEPEIRVKAKTSVRKKKNSKKIIEEKNLGVPCDARITTDFSFKEATKISKKNNIDIFELLEEEISITEIEV